MQPINQLVLHSFITSYRVITYVPHTENLKSLPSSQRLVRSMSQLEMSGM